LPPIVGGGLVTQLYNRLLSTRVEENPRTFFREYRPDTYRSDP
jgi:hypothetical protein